MNTIVNSKCVNGHYITLERDNDSSNYVVFDYPIISIHESLCGSPVSQSNYNFLTNAMQRFNEIIKYYEK